MKVCLLLLAWCWMSHTACYAQTTQPFSCSCILLTREKLLRVGQLFLCCIFFYKCVSVFCLIISTNVKKIFVIWKLQFWILYAMAQLLSATVDSLSCTCHFTARTYCNTLPWRKPPNEYKYRLTKWLFEISDWCLSCTLDGAVKWCRSPYWQHVC